MTVQELSQYLHLSTMMVYKLAQVGQIPAIKIGRVWRFEKETVDRWLKSKSVPKKDLPFHQTAQEAVEDFVHETRKKQGTQLKQILIFGSHARGDATPESDVDLLVILREPFDYSSLREKLAQTAYEVTFDKGRLVHLSIILMGESDFLTGNSPLLLNIRKEAKRAA